MIRAGVAVIALFTVVVSAVPALAQPVNLTEKCARGDRATFTIQLELKGNLIVAVSNGRQPIPLEAKAKHQFTERILAVTDGLPNSTARFYSEATATALLGADPSNRSLNPDRRLIVAAQTGDGLICFSPAGTLTRDELDLVTDHFNPQCLPGLLPGKVVSVGDTWTLTERVTQTACLFESTSKTTLMGKLTAVKDGVATFAITGSAEGFENGAKVALIVSATGTFDVSAGHITSLTWKQNDEREQGAVNPASQIEATVTLKREHLTLEPKELGDELLAGLPYDNIPSRLTDVQHTDPKGRYRLSHAREWHATAQTESHLVMRLLDRGNFIAQATLTVWNKLEPGKHYSIEEFKKAVASAPGWTPGKTLIDREVAVPAGRWLYQLTVEGKMEDVPVVQTFYLLAGPQGDQLAVTLVAKPDQAKLIANRDLQLVNAIEFGKK